MHTGRSPPGPSPDWSARTVPASQTLLNLITGMLAPSAGTIHVLKKAPGTQLANVGFVAQETPTYAGLSIADH